MKVLVVVDMQNDFIDGSLGTAEAGAILPNVVRKIRGFDGMIVLTQDTHTTNYLESQEGRKLPVVHCVEHTPGWELHPDIRRALDGKSDVKLITKPTFGSTELGQFLSGMALDGELEQITLIGLCTDICVVSNALIIKACLPEVPISVDASCCAGVSPASHETALEVMKTCQIDVIK